MVSYQAWTSILFEVVKEEGAEFENISDGGEVVSVGADVWQERKTELRTATRAEARDIARQEVSVS
jgi:hypothetical protein